MAGARARSIPRQIQTLFAAGTFCGLSDRQLLERFLASRDEVAEMAFALLVERHGAMVLGVCRRVLGDSHDAEDAFQATFLVLVRRAGAIRVEGSLGKWLFGVATRVAARARCERGRRRVRERSGVHRLEAQARVESTTAVEVGELRSIMAEELARLPVRFQDPVVICDFQGASHDEAARRLGVPVGTVKSRLARARARLRDRLARRGLSTADLANPGPLLAAAAPPRLVVATAQLARNLIAGRQPMPVNIPASVSKLAEGVLKTMFLTKIKVAAAAIFLVVAGLAVVAGQAIAQRQTEGPAGANGSGAPGSGSRSRTLNDDELEVVMLERAWADAIPRRDAAVVARIMADDFSGIDPVGNIFTKATYLPDLQNGVFSAETIELDELTPRLFGNTALVTSHISINAKPTGSRMTNVYIKRRGRWKCVSSHASGRTGNYRVVDKLDLESGGTVEHLHSQLKDVEDRVEFKLEPGRLVEHVVVDPFDSVEMVGPPSAEASLVRTQFNCFVAKVFVNIGEHVKKGNPLVELFSPDLAAAKNDFQTARIQWMHDLRTLGTRTEQFASKAGNEQFLLDARNNEEKSRLAFSRARNKLLELGFDAETIGRLARSLEPLAKAEDRNQSRLTLVAPVEGTVTEVRAKLGQIYNQSAVLVVIKPPRSTDVDAKKKGFRIPSTNVERRGFTGQ